MRRETIRAAAGRAPFDLVIDNIMYLNLFTEEIYPAQIGIAGGRVAHVTLPKEAPLEGKVRYNGHGKFAIPGLIDTHVHIESSLMNTTGFAKAVLPRGTTAVAADPHEICSVIGEEGLTYITETAKTTPLRVLTLVPSCVPAVPGVETAGADFTAEDVDRMLSLPGVQGVGEVMNFMGVINENPRMLGIIEAGLRHRMFIQGHAPSLSGRNLSAYLASGVESCHETSFSDECREKLRRGMWVECRESSICHDMDKLVPVLKEFGFPTTTTFCTDDREPDDILNQGHIDYVVKTAIDLGVPPMKAIKMATYQASILLRNCEIGAIVPGRFADICLLSDLEEFVIDDVFVAGELVAKGGELVKEIEAVDHPVEHRNTVYLKKDFTAEDFKIRASGNTAKVNVIQFNAEIPILTDLVTLELPVKDGYVDWSGRDDLAVLSIIERHGGHGGYTVGLVKDLGIHKGAIATTWSHDCHNLVVVGVDEEDIAKAVNDLREVGGGFSCVTAGETEGLVPLPIGGLMSSEDIEVLAPKVKKLKDMILDYGVRCDFALMQVASFALTVILHVRMSDLGLVDVAEQKLIPIVVE